MTPTESRYQFLFSTHAGLWNAQEQAPKHWWQPRLYEYQAHETEPMTLILTNRSIEPDLVLFCRPDRHFFTDLGSIPRVLHGLPRLGRDDFLCSYLIHDSCYKHGVLWFSLTLEGPYEPRALTKPVIDCMLSPMIQAEGGSPLAAAVVTGAVRLASPFVSYPHRLDISRVIR